jgi:hypothetical protein
MQDSREVEITPELGQPKLGPEAEQGLLQREKHQVHTKSKYGKKTPSLMCLQKSEG